MPTKNEFKSQGDCMNDDEILRASDQKMHFLAADDFVIPMNDVVQIEGTEDAPYSFVIK